MKAAALLLNAGLLSFVFYLFATRGMPHGDEVLFALLLVAAPLVNLLALREQEREESLPAPSAEQDAEAELLDERRRLRLLVEAAEERLARVDALVDRASERE